MRSIEIIYKNVKFTHFNPMFSVVSLHSGKLTQTNRHLHVQSPQWKPLNTVRDLLKVNNTETRMTLGNWLGMVEYKVDNKAIQTVDSMFLELSKSLPGSTYLFVVHLLRFSFSVWHIVCQVLGLLSTHFMYACISLRHSSSMRSIFSSLR